MLAGAGMVEGRAAGAFIRDFRAGDNLDMMNAQIWQPSVIRGYFRGGNAHCMKLKHDFGVFYMRRNPSAHKSSSDPRHLQKGAPLSQP